MRYPEFLKENGAVGFVAPSFGAATEPYHSAFNNALKKLKAMGFDTVLGPNCYASDGVGISSAPESCGREINEAMASKDSDVLISCGGGELMCEILDHVDFERIRRESPKWFMGYSDNTNLTFLLPTLCDTAAVYGPCAGTFGMEPWHESVRDALDLLRGKKLSMHSYDRWEKEGFKTEEDPLVPYNTTEPVILKPFGAKEERDAHVGRTKRPDVEMRILKQFAFAQENGFAFRRPFMFQDVAAQEVRDVLLLVFPFKYLPAEMVGMEMGRQDVQRFRACQDHVVHITRLALRIPKIIEQDRISVCLQSKTAMIDVSKFHLRFLFICSCLQSYDVSTDNCSFHNR